MVSADSKLTIEEFSGVCPVAPDTKALAQAAANFPKGRVLEMGTGTGYVAICLAQCGFEIDAVDINQKAVENAIANAKTNNVSINVFYSALFDQIKNKYDLILFNPPVNPGEGRWFRWAGKLIRKSDLLVRLTIPLVDAWCGDSRFELIQSFVSQSKDFLKTGGVVLLVSTINETKKLAQAIDNLKIDPRVPVEDDPSCFVYSIQFK